MPKVEECACCLLSTGTVKKKSVKLHTGVCNLTVADSGSLMGRGKIKNEKGIINIYL